MSFLDADDESADPAEDEDNDMFRALRAVELEAKTARAASAAVPVTIQPGSWREYLHGRGITDESIERFGIREYRWFDGKDYIGIPMVVQDGEEPLWRLYDRFSKANKMRWSRKRRMQDDGRTPAEFLPPFPSMAALAEADVICEGEWDCILLIQQGIKSASGTAGSGSWNDEWVEAVGFHEVTTLYDHDDPDEKTGKRPGKDGAEALATKSLGTVRIATWPKPTKDGYDVTDFFMAGGTIAELRDILAAAVVFTPVAPEVEAPQLSFVDETRQSPPADPNAETAAVGMCLIDRKAIVHVAASVKADDFTVGLNRDVFEAMVALHERGEEVTPVSVSGELDRTFPRTGGPGWLYDVMGIMQAEEVLHASLDNAIERITFCATQRSILRTATDVSRLVWARDIPTAGGLVSEAYRRFTSGVSAERQGTQLVAPMDALHLYFEVLERRQSKDPAYVGWPTGLGTLDESVRLRRGELVYVYAAPSVGKTALLLTMANNLASRAIPVPVLFASIEQPMTQLMDRLIAADADVNGADLATGTLNENDWARVTDAMERHHQKKLIIYEDGSMTTASLEAQLHLAKQKYGVEVCLVDYLTLMADTNKDGNEAQRVGYVSGRLREMARDLNICIISAVQLNRKYADRTDPMPKLTDARESGRIEQDAFVVLGLWRPTVGDGRANAQVQVLKNRNGESGLVHSLFFNEQRVRFEVGRVVGGVRLPVTADAELRGSMDRAVEALPAEQRSFLADLES